ncbi:MAG: hypothetical protein ACXWKG_02185 [Limisphaerales bacterium]
MFISSFSKSVRPFFPKLSPFGAALVIVLSLATNSHAQLSKGFQILLTRGLQMQGLSQWADFWTYSTYTNANYSSVNWGSQSRPESMAPGMAWSRWATDETQMPPQDLGNGDETPIMPQLFALQLGDEKELNDDTTRNNMVNWFNSVRSNFPNTILYHNNYGGQVSDPALGDFISRAHPDMLSWDTYPFHADGSGNPITGRPYNWYGDLWRYRQFGLGYQIPTMIYRQCYHSTAEGVRDPSPSELRLLTSMALAYNYKMICDFVYNAGATSLFTIDQTGYNGDTGAPKPLYTEMIDVNKRASNLGKALIRLTPVYDMHNTNTTTPPPGPGSTDPNFPVGTTTSIMWLQGRYLANGTTNLNVLPSYDFQNDPQESPNPANQNNLCYSWWESGKNDPYLNGWGVTNKGGLKNDGLIGDVVISWFHPIDDGYSPGKNTNEVYMMVVNGLSDATGSAADCLQEIKLNFLVGTNVSAVEMLDPVTGLVSTNTMPVIGGTSGSGTKRQLVLDLNGGDAALFKFSDGVPFVTLPVAGKLSAAVANGQPTFTVRGPYAANYRIEYSTSLTAGSWNTLKSVQVSAATGNVTFTDPAGSATRFYRAIALP